MRVDTHHSFQKTVQSEDALQFNDVVPNINLPYLQTGIVQKTSNNNGTLSQNNRHFIHYCVKEENEYKSHNWIQRAKAKRQVIKNMKQQKL